MQNQISLTLQLLLARFDGQVLIPFGPASKVIGIPEQTARNKLSAGTFPVKTVLNGTRRFIHVADLAEFVDSLRPESTIKKRGRPLKASRFQSNSLLEGSQK